jgi:hypothetical protein
MSYRGAAWMGTLWDIGLTLFQLAHLILVGFFVDAAGNGDALRKGVAIYLPFIHGAIVTYLLWSTYVKMGQKGAMKKNPETVFGIFAEVLNVTMFFGVLYNCARVWSKDSADPFHQAKFLDNLLISTYDSATVQAGIGFVSTTPTTAFEYIATFLSAYCGGVLFVNMMLINLVFGRRHWASLPEEKEKLLPSAPAPVQAAIDNWKLNSIVSARA